MTENQTISKIREYQEKTQRKLAEADSKERERMSRVGDLEQRFMDIGERFIAMIKRREAKIKGDKNAVEGIWKPRQKVSENLQKSYEVMQLSETDNRLLIRLKNFPDWIYGERSVLMWKKDVESAVGRDEVYQKLIEIGNRVKSLRFNAEKSDLEYLDNSDEKYCPHSCRDESRKYQIFSIGDFFGRFVQFYRVLIETRKMNEDCYNGLLADSHPLIQTIQGIEEIVKYVDKRKNKINEKIGFSECDKRLWRMKSYMLGHKELLEERNRKCYEYRQKVDVVTVKARKQIKENIDGFVDSFNHTYGYSKVEDAWEVYFGNVSRTSH